MLKQNCYFECLVGKKIIEARFISYGPSFQGSLLQLIDEFGFTFEVNLAVLPTNYVYLRNLNKTKEELKLLLNRKIKDIQVTIERGDTTEFSLCFYTDNNLYIYIEWDVESRNNESYISKELASLYFYID
jgi:hypothetical protein